MIAFHYPNILIMNHYPFCIYSFVDGNQSQSNLNNQQENVNTLLKELRGLVESQKQNISANPRTNTIPLAGIYMFHLSREIPFLK